ncbi:MAG: ImmA/IrrE family metallo-endopeptidase [Sporolactobacillus sp.]
MAEQTTKFYEEDDLLKEVKLNGALRDPFELADKEHISVLSANFSFSSIIGMIKRRQENTMFYLSQYATVGWQRFTLAHMLAHYYLHFSSQKKTSWYCRQHYLSDGVSPEEEEADLFARELLLPVECLKKECAQLNTDLVMRLMTTYRLPKQLVESRLKETNVWHD